MSFGGPEILESLNLLGALKARGEIKKEEAITQEGVEGEQPVTPTSEQELTPPETTDLPSSE